MMQGQGQGFSLKTQSAAPRRRAKAGKLGEEPVQAQLEACRKAGLGCVFRVPNSWQVIANHGYKVTAVPKERTGPDYIGVLASGRAIALEVKHISAERLKRGGLSAIRFQLDHLEPHQLQDLEDFAKRGGLAFLCLVHGSLHLGGAFYLVPVDVVSRAVKAGRVSLLSDDLDAFQRPKNKLLLEGLE